MKRLLANILIVIPMAGFISLHNLINPSPNRPNLTYEFLAWLTTSVAMD